MSLSNFVVFFISALSHFPSAKFTHILCKSFKSESKISGAFNGLVQLEMTNWFDFVAWILRPKSPFRPLPFSLFSSFARNLWNSLHLFSFQRFAHWNLNQEKKLSGIIRVSLWTFTFYPPPPLLMKRPHLMLIFSCPQPFWHLHYFCRSFFDLLDK